MWVVGILRHGNFRPLEEAPTFREVKDAKVWAQIYLRKNPEALIQGVDVLTWRLVD